MLGLARIGVKIAKKTKLGEVAVRDNQKHHMRGEPKFIQIITIKPQKGGRVGVIILEDYKHLQ